MPRAKMIATADLPKPYDKPEKIERTNGLVMVSLVALQLQIIGTVST